MFETETYTVTIESILPGLIMNNGMMADPDNPIVQRREQLKPKIKTSEEASRQYNLLGIRGSLYIVENKVVLPQSNLQKMLYVGAPKINKMKGKSWVNGITVLDHAILEHDGPENIDELIEDENYRLTMPVVIDGKRVMKTRGFFKTWKANVIIDIEPDLVDSNTSKNIFEVSGREAGLCDWRPEKKGKYGRFIVTNFMLNENVIEEAA